MIVENNTDTKNKYDFIRVYALGKDGVSKAYLGSIWVDRNKITRNQERLLSKESLEGIKFIVEVSKDTDAVDF